MTDVEMCGTEVFPEILANAVALKITAPVLRTELIGPDPMIWVAFDEKFKSGDNLPVYFADEIKIMKSWTVEQIFKAHAVKALMPGARIRE